MTTLTTTPHTALLLPASVTFYFGVQAGRSHELPIGAVFGCVYSPTDFSGGVRPWRYVRWRVKWCQFRKGQGKERGYAVDAERDLTPDEAAFFENEWKELQEAERETAAQTTVSI